MGSGQVARPVRSRARDRVASLNDRGAATSNGARHKDKQRVIIGDKPRTDKVPFVFVLMNPRILTLYLSTAILIKHLLNYLTIIYLIYAQ